MDPNTEGGPPKAPIDTVEVEVEVKQVCNDGSKEVST